MTPDIRARIGLKGAMHPNYKGGWRDQYGYIHVGDILRSHIAWNTAHPNDPVKRGEVVHHMNEIKDDDRPENLHKFQSQSEHWKHHAPLVVATRTRDAEGKFV